MNILIGASNQYKTFGSYITELISVAKRVDSVQKTEEIIFDLSECKFSNPTLIAGLIILREGLALQGFDVSFNKDFLNKSFENYLSTIYFPNCVNPFLLSEHEFGCFFLKNIKS